MCQYQNLKTNYAIYDSLLGVCLDEIKDDITLEGKEKIYKLEISSGNEEKRFFKNAFQQRMGDIKILYSVDSSFADYIISINKVIFKTLYPEYVKSPFIGNDFLERKISISFEYKLTSKDFKLINGKVFSKSYTGEINTEYLEYLEGNEYAFMRQELPPKSFFQKFLIPATATLVSAAAIILFFTIRSK